VFVGFPFATPAMVWVMYMWNGVVKSLSNASNTGQSESGGRAAAGGISEYFTAGEGAAAKSPPYDRRDIHSAATGTRKTAASLFLLKNMLAPLSDRCEQPMAINRR
jgi:hypothetical protein